MALIDAVRACVDAPQACLPPKPPESWSSYLYSITKDFQTLIAGALGFLFATTAALYNARLNRLRDDRLRAVEARALAVALSAEAQTVEHQISFLTKNFYQMSLTPADYRFVGDLRAPGSASV